MAKLKERRNIMHTATDYINILIDKKILQKYCNDHIQYDHLQHDELKQ